jgi:salicylate hydroxylase
MIDRAFRICSTDGKEHNRIDLTSKVEYGGDRVVYHRQDLHSVLKSAATSPNTWGPGAEIRVSSRVVSVDCETGSVRLENEDVLEGFDLIVGADGIRSRVRSSVLGREVEPVATGVAAYRMMIKAADIEGDDDIRKFLDPRDSCTTMVMGHDCRLIMGPARNGELYSIVAMVPDGEPNHPSSSIYCPIKLILNSESKRGHSNHLLDNKRQYVKSSRKFQGLPKLVQTAFRPRAGTWTLAA